MKINYICEMKPYVNSNGKSKWSLFWGDKVKKKFNEYFHLRIKNFWKR